MLSLIMEAGEISGLQEEAEKINKLVDKDLVSPGEASHSYPERLDELIQRFDQISRLSEQEGFEKARAKVETTLGLGNKKDKPTRTELATKGFMLAVYLKLKYKKTFDGLVLYGSRVHPEKTPSKFTDQDMAIVTTKTIGNSVDVPDNEIDFITGAKLACLKIMGVEADISTIWGVDLQKSKSDIATSERLRSSHKVIDKNSISIIPNPETKKLFDSVFSEQMKNSQTDFKPDFATTILGN